jgi:hypothetical protein
MPLRELLKNWSPAIFCGLLIFISLKQINSSSSTVFLIWLPMCFLSVGNVTHSLYKQVQGLRSEVASLRSQVVNPGGHA